MKHIKPLLCSVVFTLSLLLMVSCGKKTEDADLELEIYPKTATVLNVNSFSCKDFNTSPTPSSGSLQGPMFSIYKMILRWKSKNYDIDIVSMRFIFRSSIFQSGVFESVVAMEDMSSYQPLAYNNFLGCNWCRIRYYDDTNDTTKAISVVTIEDGQTFAIDGDGNRTRESQSIRRACGPRIGALPFKPGIKSETTISGYVVVQALKTKVLDADNDGDGMKDRDPTEITNFYKSFPVRILYQPPPTQ
jgi:hypothetical protein